MILNFKARRKLKYETCCFKSHYLSRTGKSQLKSLMRKNDFEQNMFTCHSEVYGPMQKS